MIVVHQPRRRNLPPAAIGDLKLEEKEIVARQAKERQGKRTDLAPNLAQSSEQGRTLDQLGTSATQMHKAQFAARRNLSKYDRSVLALELEPLYAAEAKRRQAEYHGNQYESGVRQKSDEVQTPTRTDEQLAKLAGTSRDTIRKVKVIEQEAEEATSIQRGLPQIWGRPQRKVSTTAKPSNSSPRTYPQDERERDESTNPHRSMAAHVAQMWHACGTAA